jgi:hypothetical protein
MYVFMQTEIKTTLLNIRSNANRRVSYLIRDHLEEIESMIAFGISISQIASELTKDGFKVSRQTIARQLKISKKTSAMDSEAKRDCIHKPPVQPEKFNLPISLERPKTVQQHLERQKDVQNEAKKILAIHPVIPPEVENHKFFEFDGEIFDATKINIDDHMKVSRDHVLGEKVSPDISKIIRKENLFKGLYENALKNYGIALVDWQSKQSNQT